MDKLRHLLHDPRVVGVDTDSPEILEVHRNVLLEKPLMQSVFQQFYSEIVDARERYLLAEGGELELGAGISLFKQFRSLVTSSDIKKTPHCDLCIDAQNMDVKSNSLAAIYGINCFHHFPDPVKFFSELDRVLKPGGGAVLIEPYHGPFSSFLYSKLHDNEHFDKGQICWATDGIGAMSGANQALSYIVFKRDEKKFQQCYPNLEIVETRILNNYLEYLLSGGLNFRQLIPSFGIPLIRSLQALLTPLAHLFALHQVIVIRKKLNVE